jgi:hypothetical protein
MTLRIGDAYGGFHGFNEAFYALYAQKYFGHPLAYLITGATDFNNPPLLSYLLFLSFKILGVGEAQARLVPIIFSLLTLIYVYRLGTILYGKLAGLISAAFLGVFPAFVVVGRNVQLEAIFIFFAVTSLFYYIKSAQSQEFKNKCIAGLFLGIGLLGKWPAVFIIAPIVAWEFSRSRSLRWINRTFACFILVAFAVPLPWVAYHLIKNSETFLGQQGVRAATFQMPSWVIFVNSMLIEFIWMVSPLVFALVVASVVRLFWQRKQADWMLISGGAVYGLFYFFYFQHSYYVFPLLIFAALALGQLLASIPRRVLLPVIGFIVLTTAFLALVALSGHKYGYDELRQLGGVVDDAEGNQNIIWVSQDTHGSFEPIIRYYSGASVRIKEEAAENDMKQIPPGENVFLLARIPAGQKYTSDKAAGFHVLDRTIFGPVLFGLAFVEDPYRSHFFAVGGIKTLKAGGLTAFGIRPVGKDPTWAVLDLTRYREHAMATRKL